MKQNLNENVERKETELLVFIKAKDLCAYILKASAGSPVRYRYSLLNPLINDSLEIIQILYMANELSIHDEKRLSLVNEAKAKLKILDFLSSLAMEAACFTRHQYEVILEKIGICSKYLQGYMNACKKALGHRDPL